MGLQEGREISRWLNANGVEGLPEGSWSAEAYGALLAAQLERATFMDEPFFAVCVDPSKAFDSVRLDLLEHLLSCSGLPAWCGGPR